MLFCSPLTVWSLSCVERAALYTVMEREGKTGEADSEPPTEKGGAPAPLFLVGLKALKRSTPGRKLCMGRVGL